MPWTRQCRPFLRVNCHAIVPSRQVRIVSSGTALTPPAKKQTGMATHRTQTLKLAKTLTLAKGIASNHAIPHRDVYPDWGSPVSNEAPRSKLEPLTWRVLESYKPKGSRCLYSIIHLDPNRLLCRLLCGLNVYHVST